MVEEKSESNPETCKDEAMGCLKLGNTDHSSENIGDWDSDSNTRTSKSNLASRHLNYALEFYLRS